MSSEQQPLVDELAEDLATAIKVHATSEGFETVASTVGHSLLAPLKAIVAGVKKGWGPEHDYKDGFGESWGKFKHEFKHILDNLKEDVSRSGIRQRMDDANKFHEILKGLPKEEAEIIAPMLDRALTNIQKNSLAMTTKGMVSGGLAITGTSHLWHGLRAAVTHIITDWTADLALKTAHTKIRGVDSENAKENRQENIEDDEELAKLEEIQKKLTAAFNPEDYEGSELLIILSNAGLISPIKEETKDQIHGSSSPKTESKFMGFFKNAKDKLEAIVGKKTTTTQEATEKEGYQKGTVKNSLTESEGVKVAVDPKIKSPATKDRLATPANNTNAKISGAYSNR